MGKWVVRNRRADFYGLAEKFHLDPLIIRLMVNRGMETEEQIETVLHGGEAVSYTHRRKNKQAGENLPAGKGEGNYDSITHYHCSDRITADRLCRLRLMAGEAVGH